MATSTSLNRSERIIKFIEKYCLTPEGAKVGTPLKLANFQKNFIRELYDNPHGTRRAYLSLARKNGKTALCAAILLAHLVGPEARLNSQIISGARSREQASVLFKLAAKMVNLSPELQKLVRIIPSSKTLIGLAMNVEYRALAADGSTAHGLSPVLAILDEAGQVKGPQDDFFDAITTAQGAHDNPLLIVISTQAPTDADLLSIWLDDAARSNDPTIVSHVYAAPKDCELDDADAWKAANPGIDLFRSREDVAEQAKQAMRMPTAEAAFRNLTLNQRVNVFSPFISPSVWKECGGEVLPFTGPVYGGLDLAETTDLCAFVLVGKVGDNWHVRSWFWKPEATLLDHVKRDRAPYDAWARAGHLETTPGVAVDYEFVAAKIAEACAGLDVRQINFDRYRFKALEQRFQAIGVTLPFEPFGQGYVSMAPAMDATEIEFLNGRVRHGGHPVLTMCAANAVIERDAAGNKKLTKAKSTGRIDGMVALVMAMGAAMQDVSETAHYSPFDDPNFELTA